MSTHHSSKRLFANRHYFYIFLAVVVVVFVYIQWSVQDTYSAPEMQPAAPSSATPTLSHADTVSPSAQTSPAPVPDYIFNGRIADNVTNKLNEYHVSIIQNKVGSLSGVITVRLQSSYILKVGSDYTFGAVYNASDKVYDVLTATAL